jgi:hypothetical protein
MGKRKLGADFGAHKSLLPQQKENLFIAGLEL